MRSVLSRIVPSSGRRARTAPCPVPWPATLSSFSAAKRTVLATSSALSAKATASGRWSAARFQAWRASSQSGSLGVATRPAIASPVKSLIWSPRVSSGSSVRRCPRPPPAPRSPYPAGRGRGRRRRGRPRGGRQAPPGRRSRRCSRRSGRRRGCAERRAASTAEPSRSRVEAMPKAKSSSGTGALSASTGLLESAMTTKRSAAAATIFSRRWAPPPPLISQPSGVTWSVPSIAMSSRRSWLNSSTGMPSPRACSSVATEVATQRMPLTPRAAIAGSRWATVEPVPSPTVIPSSTSSAAASAAMRFSASALTAPHSTQPGATFFGSTGRNAMHPGDLCSRRDGRANLAHGRGRRAPFGGAHRRAHRRRPRPRGRRSRSTTRRSPGTTSRSRAAAGC